MDHPTISFDSVDVNPTTTTTEPVISSPSSLPTTIQLPPSITDVSSVTTATSTTSPSEKQPLAAALQSYKSLLSNERPMKILLLSSDTGGGHKASAQALEHALKKATHPHSTSIETIDFWVDAARGPFSKFPQQYTFLAKHPWMWKFTYEITRFPPGRAVTESFFSTFGHENVRDTFIKYQPDVIVSVHPLVNTLSMRVLKDLVKKGLMKKKPCYVTVVTDLGGAHPTWFHRDADMTYVPIEEVKNIAMKCGLINERIKVFGLPVRPDFWDDIKETKEDIRKRLGILTDAYTVLAVGGGDGVGGLKSIATALSTDLPLKLKQKLNTSTEIIIQIVVICGKNDKLKNWLREQNWNENVSVISLGYVSNMSEWMLACDIVCTKAGPGTIAESLIRGLPIIITGFLPGQEEANVKFIVDHNVGKFAKKPNKIVDLVADWLTRPGVLKDMSSRAKQLSRPMASVDIAMDIIKVVKQYVCNNMNDLESEERSISARDKSRGRIRSGALSPYVPVMGFLEGTNSASSEWKWNSHLGIRVKILMKLIMGSMFVRDISTNSGNDNVPRRTPPTSPPLNTITENGDISNHI